MRIASTVAATAALLVLSCGGGSGGVAPDGGKATGGGTGDIGGGTGTTTGIGTGGVSTTCTSPAACGGNVVGTWSIVSSCLDVPSDLSTVCPTATYDTTGFKFTGTVTYNADLTYTESITESGSFGVVFPVACLTSGGTTVTCAQLNAALPSALAGGEFQSATCVDASSGSGCSCTFTLIPQSSTEMGTYTTAASALTLTSSDGSVTNITYCAAGTQLTESSSEMAMPGGGAASGTIVLQKH